MIFAACSDKKRQDVRQPATDTIPVLVTQVKKCAKLYTAEYRVHKIVTHDDQVKLKGSFLQQKFDISLPLTSDSHPHRRHIESLHRLQPFQ